MHRVIVFFAAFGVASSEFRKLMPLCSNSCQTPYVQSECFCDSKCSLVYNDCCLDAPYRTIRASTQLAHNINCVFVHGENRHFWMVDTCRAAWTGSDHVREKCLSTSVVSGESNDVIGSVPVTNVQQGVTFRSYYCALCNDQSPNDLVEWKVKALCANEGIQQGSLLQNLTFVEDLQRWGVYAMDEDENWAFNECHLVFQRPTNVTSGVRTCAGDVVGSCPKTWKNMGVRRKCKSYVDPVKWRSGPVYRNVDCAICHNRTTEDYRCVHDVTVHTSAIMLRRAMKVDLSSMGQWF